MISILFLIIYGFMQIRIIKVFRNVCFEEIEGLALIVVSFANFFVFCSGGISVAFVTVITSMCYESCDLDTDKTDIFILASFGYILYFIVYLVILMFLNKINYGHLQGYICAENLKQCKDYVNIQIVTKLFNLFYYVYMLIAMTLLMKDTWQTSLKYGILLMIVYILQNFILNRG